MGRHTAPRRRTSRGKVVLGTLALAGAAAVLVMGGQGTFASWTDNAAISGGNISSGTLDLKVDGAQGNPTAYAKTDLAMASMLPGESVARTIAVTNAGDADFTWIPSATTGGGIGPALTVKLVLGGTAAGNDTRTGTCTGGTTLVSGTTASRLNKGAAAQTLCVQVTLPAGVDDTYQGKTTGSVGIALNAAQVLP